MFQPKSCRIILLSIFCLSIGIVFAAQLPIVKGENEFPNKQINKQSITFKQQPLNDLLSNLAVEEKKKTCCGQSENVLETFTLIGSYYSLRNGQETVLMFNNKGPQPLAVNPVFFNLDGIRLDLPTLTIPAKSYQEYDVRDLLANHLPQFREGSLQVSHEGGRLQLGAQFKILKQGMIFDEQFIQPALRFPSNRLEGVWWRPSTESDTKFILSNTTASAVTATVQVEGTIPQQPQPATVYLNPHETRVLDILEDLLGGQQGDELKRDGGISITHTGAAGAIIARILISEPDNGYSSVVNFTDPTTPLSSKLNGGGLRIGAIAGDNLKPIVVARNIGATTTTISGQIPYTDANGNVQFVQIPATQINAGKTKHINLRQEIEAANIPANVGFAGINLEYSTAPGTVVMNALSVSQSGQQVFQVPLLDPERLPSSAGGFPWKADGNYTTVIFIKNESNVPKKYIAYLAYEGGSYSPGEREIKPWQTVMVDFKQLRDSQTPNSMGSVIPLNIQSGQASWSMMGADNKKMTGRSEQVNTVTGIASNYACYNCCPDSRTTTGVEPGTILVYVGSGLHQFLVQTQTTNCYGQSTPVTMFLSGWTTANPPIATITNDGLAEPISPGTATFTVNWTDITWYDQGINNCWMSENPGAGTGEMNVRPRITSITPLKGSVGGKILVSIDGTGFTQTTTIVPITGITFSDIERHGTTTIVANFNISGNATSGDNTVQVKNGNLTSNGVDFFVQIPKKARRDELANTVIIDPGPGDIVDIFGQTFQTNRCGAYRNLKYTLLDQDDEVLVLGASEGLAISEVFSNAQISPPEANPPTPITTSTNNVGVFGDIIGATSPFPQCPPAFSYSATQKFKVTVNSQVFNLTTQNTLGVSKNSTGRWSITVTDSTPNP